MHSSEYRSFGYWPKDINEALTGMQFYKLIFLFAELTVPIWSAAPVESCQSVVRRSPRGRLGSVLDVRKSLDRIRRGVQLQVHLPRCISADSSDAFRRNCQCFRSIALCRAPTACACGVGDYPPSDLPNRTSESRSASQESVLFGLDSTRERQIR